MYNRTCWICGGRWVLVGPPVFKTGEWGSEPHWCVRFARTPAIYETVLFEYRTVIFLEDFMKRKWTDESVYGKDTVTRVLSMSNEEYEAAFDGNLKFGTAGLRGYMDAGTNRMNVFTVKKAAIAIAKWIKKNNAEDRGVVIGYDVRHNSRDFAKITASVMEYFNIKYYFFDEIVATPHLSYSVRHLKTFCGVMVTASHNPKDYNGYKVYKRTGSQILEDDAEIIEYFMSEINEEELANIPNKKPIEFNFKHVFNDYYRDIMSLSMYDDKTPFKMVYSPYNGCGEKTAKKILKDKNVMFFIPKEQEFPDPDFTTIPYPNPEVKETFSLAIDLAEKENANLIVVNDPDADRMSFASREGKIFRIFSGNEIGAILIYYLLLVRKERGLTTNGRIVKTIVTDDLGIEIARDFGYKTFETLTGFKNISVFANELDGKDEEFIFGYEESIGYEIGSVVRDKDGLSALLYVVDAYRYFKNKNMTFQNVLEEIHQNYGYHIENNFSIYFEGVDSSEKMNGVMKEFREDFVDHLFDIEVDKRKDYLLETGSMKTNALIYNLKNGIKICMRPSGTEPKLKIYMYGVGDDKEKIMIELNKLRKKVEQFAK